MRLSNNISSEVGHSDASWESSFVGAVAIPLAAGQYQGLYRKLAGQLFQDPEFRKALAKPTL